MTWADTTNGIYESMGGLFMLANCVKVYKDKEVKGISLLSMLFFTSWGYWNLYYYPSLSQWMSTVGAAKKRIKEILTAESNRCNGYLRAFPCNRCGFWHVTSKLNDQHQYQYENSDEIQCGRHDLANQCA